MKFTLDGELHLTDCPPALRRALMDELTVQNPAYAQAVRLNRPAWNIPKELLLYKVTNNELVLPRGMATEVWRRRPAGTVRCDNMTVLATPDWPQSNITLRGYQQRAAAQILQSKAPQGVLVMPCGAGKTETGLHILQCIGQPTLWIAHTRDLVQQTYDRARTRLNLCGDQLGMLTGATRRIGTHLTVATVQTLYHMDMDELAPRFGCVVVDECQHVCQNPSTAQMFAAVLGCLPARYRYGLTATPTRGDGLENTIYQILGGRLAVVEQEELTAAGGTILPAIQPVYTNFVYQRSAKEEQAVDTARLRRHMTHNAPRTELIAAAILNELLDGHTCLVLGATLELLGLLHERLRTQFPTRFISGATRQRERRDAIEDIKSGAAKCLFATYQLAKEGLDIPCADRLFFIQPVRDSVAVQQAVGRVMRPAQGKTGALVYDFVDIQVPSCKSQYAARKAVYRKLNATILQEEKYHG